MPDDPPEEPPEDAPEDAPLLMPELAPELMLEESPELPPELMPEEAPELPADELPMPELPLVPSVELIPELDMPLEPGPDDEPTPLLEAEGLPPPDEREYRESLVVTQVRVGVPLGPVVMCQSPLVVPLGGVDPLGGIDDDGVSVGSPEPDGVE